MHQHLSCAIAAKNLATLHATALRDWRYATPLPLSKKELLLQLLAAQDTSGDSSPDASPVDLSLEMGLAAPSTKQKEDF
ncbi:hypothetical protein C0995_006535 [Termitomyces sp. Mi166|nr:hypothetical protein C0995_006535 [Termitomyces sp. Mi166\